MSFEIDYDRQPKKFLKKQDKQIINRILTKIDNLLIENPVPHDSKSIVGKHNCFRIRIGKHRALYRINYQTNKIIIFKLDKRPKAYN